MARTQWDSMWRRSVVGLVWLGASLVRGPATSSYFVVSSSILPRGCKMPSFYIYPCLPLFLNVSLPAAVFSFTTPLGLMPNGWAKSQLSPQRSGRPELVEFFLLRDDFVVTPSLQACKSAQQLIWMKVSSFIVTWEGWLYFQLWPLKFLFRTWNI